MDKINLIDAQIYPDFSGGLFAGNAYIDPASHEKKYLNTFAAPELAKQWQARVLEIVKDVRRAVIHVSEGNSSSGIDYLQAYVKFLRQSLTGTNRLIETSSCDLNNLSETITNRGLELDPEVKIIGYGHHRGDCVPSVGKEIAEKLGLDESRFTELEDLSVGDMVMDRLEIIKKINLNLYYFYSDKYIDVLRGQKKWTDIERIKSQHKYLFIYCSAEQVTEAARTATTIEEFENLIGENFTTFDFIEDYIAACEKYGIKP